MFFDRKVNQMINVVLLHEGALPTVEETYRSFQYLVKNYGISLTKIDTVHEKTLNLDAIDVIVCVRGHSPMIYGILKVAARHNKKIYFLLDDALKDLPKGSFWYPERKKWLMKCLSTSDGLLASNQLIADEYKRYIKGKQVIVINTAIDPLSIQKPRKIDENVRVVMAASEWHTENFERYIKPIIPQLMERFKGKIDLYFIGLHPNLEHNVHIHYVPSMSMSDYVEYMSSNKFDVGIGVLSPNYFTERKYFNKFIEYTRYGICGVYTKCMPFELVVKDEINGFFTQNTPKAWLDALCKAIENTEMRRNCIANAQEYLKEKHNEKYLFAKLVAECPELISYKSVMQCKKYLFELIHWRVRQLIFRICERTYLTFSSLSHFGVKTTIAKIKRKLRGSQ